MNSRKSIPAFCDFDCPYADFAPAETAGICRTMAGVWCRQLQELVRKNTPCEWRKRQAAKTSRRGAAPDRPTAPRAKPKARNRK